MTCPTGKFVIGSRSRWEPYGGRVSLSKRSKMGNLRTAEGTSENAPAGEVSRVPGIAGALVLLAWGYLSLPLLQADTAVERGVDVERMRAVVRKLSEEFHPRTYDRKDNLTATATYIFDHFTKAGGEPEYQEFEARGGSYRNVRCLFGNKSGPRIVVGAHYDSCGDTPGADDNASGVAGLIEHAQSMLLPYCREWIFRITEITGPTDTRPSWSPIQRSAETRTITGRAIRGTRSTTNEWARSSRASTGQSWH